MYNYNSVRISVRNAHQKPLYSRFLEVSNILEPRTDVTDERSVRIPVSCRSKISDQLRLRHKAAIEKRCSAYRSMSGTMVARWLDWPALTGHFDPQQSFWHRPFNPNFGQPTWMPVKCADQDLGGLLTSYLASVFVWLDL